MALGHWAVEYLGEGNGQGGSGGGGLVVHVSTDEATGEKTLDKTWQEIHDALAAGTYTMVLEGDTSSDNLTPAMVGGVFFDEDYGYGVIVYTDPTSMYYAQTANSYPTIGGGSI